MSFLRQFVPLSRHGFKGRYYDCQKSIENSSFPGKYCLWLSYTGAIQLSEQDECVQYFWVLRLVSHFVTTGLYIILKNCLFSQKCEYHEVKVSFNYCQNHRNLSYSCHQGLSLHALTYDELWWIQIISMCWFFYCTFILIFRIFYSFSWRTIYNL